MSLFVVVFCHGIVLICGTPTLHGIDRSKVTSHQVGNTTSLSTKGQGSLLYSKLMAFRGDLPPLCGRVVIEF